MLDDFLLTNRAAIVTRTQAMVAARGSPKLGVAEQAANGVSAFLDQLVVALRLARSTDVSDHAQIAKSGAMHGLDLLRMGLTIAEVVRDYGDVCQTITELVIEQEAEIAPGEFQVLNLCLDDATAEAVSAFAQQSDQTNVNHGTERLGVLAHEMQNLLNTATLSLDSITSGRVVGGGSTGRLLRRSLLSLRDLVDRSLADVRLDAGIDRTEVIVVGQLIDEVEIGASMQAQAQEVRLTVRAFDRGIRIKGDRQILAAAIANLLQNAFKFTHKDGNVSLSTVQVGDRLHVEIEDECGGLPPGKPEELFRPFEQRSSDRSGVGLGLGIARRAARASGGEVRVRDLPGKGCVFTLDLPIQGAPEALPVDTRAERRDKLARESKT